MGETSCSPLIEDRRTIQKGLPRRQTGLRMP